MSLLRIFVIALAGLMATATRAERIAPDAATIAPAPVGLAIAGDEPRAAEPFGLPRGRELAALTAKTEKLRRDMAADRLMLALCRQGYAGCTSGARRFLATIEAAGRENGRARLGHVNRAVNLAVAYTPDAVQHGEADVWSSALDTFASQKGDCEDYAIAKYQALIELGIAARDLRLVVTRQRDGGWHAVLAARSGHEWLILDNRRLLLVADTDLRADEGLAAYRLDAEPLGRG